MTEDDKNKRLDPNMTHSCDLQCLGSLTFHPNTVGDMICLSEGGRRAQRAEDTFKGGVVFTSRPVKTHERIRVLVEKRVPHWQGAIRVCFTNVPPSARSLPLPPFSMPDLTQTSGHWAIPLHDSYCQEGSVLEFWVSDDGSIYYKNNNGNKQKLPKEVDVRKPLWAMIDVYGQTCSVFLLGSEKKDLLFKRTSCPLIRRPSSLKPDSTTQSGKSDDCISFRSMEIPADDRCVVCMTREADTTLPCGHRCLCLGCTSRVLVQFGTCPLCRVKIDTGVTFEGSMISKTGHS
ncbi:E3 ubiquitin-protein ligase NEURL3-like [Gambusia affinis]|uniref:E3 ubiquitin-protein ligase NEURL3-like n=1 Tax=Gambusia affinis TaxID=33528 RepID=UPI001CDBEE64|nr:E3 ubiquitin-protein ligase NEURL3-like [Gambusia affinis]XP_043967184.1 E3 ubiquitin-protein ligase NEURL3-like [Gambusia affinis]XP_043967185.1 E3 ubiquitin-protein ligase NEURL3-like [Gambusia affinis]XP_043967186.1 E3 ubiquitin-protein ligase NEURL3-like [Gambusia affinis]XP_043967187.1 E3 ubiquitin-protein ligase NEURL3-like [Gambusia affinis]XP_043967189.1 E3 ubiquitin-protein ligase NEURL3-like [Gambusia affinis]XP_043967190.1 E3 ubiquitin-protein ligase NEURL3-like [Gambusia affini